MSDRIVERIVREAEVPELVEVLAARLSAADLQSLLLEVYRRRAQAETPARLMERYATSRFTRPSPLAPGALLELDHLAFGLLPEAFVPLELSPMAPFGATAVVTGTSQDRIVTTVRQGEVAADSTNALALECALRRQALLALDARSGAPVKLAASQRLVRAQALAGPGFSAHFRLFALCSAGRDAGSFAFEIDSLCEQIGFHVRLVDAWRALGAPISGIRVALTPLDDGPAEALLRERVLEPLAAAHPAARFEIDLARTRGRGYYQRACFLLHALDAEGEALELCDGGFTDWTQQLVGSRKERLMISGIGAERLVALRRAPPERARGQDA
jgi:hypothetical protein